VYSNCVLSVLCVAETMYSNQELADMHFMYGLADSNVAVARRLYQERYPGRRSPDGETAAFVNMEIVHLVLPIGDDQDLRFLK
jgi:hypothetical protein